MDVTLIGQSFESQLVLWAEDVQALGFPRKARVRAVLTEEVKLAELLGQEARLLFDDERGGPLALMRGVVVDVALVASADPGSPTERVLPTYEFTLLARLGLLEGFVDCRIFQDQTTQQIVTTLLEEVGLAADQQDWKLTGSSVVRPYCVQYRESSLNFISRLLEDEGQYFFCDSDDEGKERVYFRDDSTAALLSPEVAVPLRQNTQANQDEDRAVFSLAHELGVTTGKVSLQAFDFEKPAYSLASEHVEANPELEVYGVLENYTTIERGGELARIRSEEAHARARTTHFVTNALEISAGFGFSISDGEEEPSKFFVTRVAREYTQDPGASHGMGAARGYSARVEALPLDQKFRPTRVHRTPRAPGPQTAIVTGPADAEAETVDTDAFGRVTVKFHWDRRGKNDNTSSCALRVAQLQTSGSLILPRLGWEVVVEFLNGSLDQPVVTGRLFNGLFGPPYKLPEGKTRTSLQSASSPSGGGRNEIRFEDAAGSEEMMINSQYNTAIVAANNRKKNVTRNETQIIGNNAELLVGADQTVQVTGGHETTVTGNQAVTISGNRKNEVNAIYGLTVTGNSTTSVGGNWMSMVGSPLDALIALGVSKAADLASAQADKVFQAVNASAQGAIDQATGAISGLTEGADAISASMDQLANGKMAASAGVLGGAVALPGADDVMRSLAQGPAMARAAEGTEASSGGIALGALLRGGAVAKVQQVQKSALAALGAGQAQAGEALQVQSESNSAGPVGDLAGFSAEDTTTGPGFSQIKVASTHDETISGARLQVALEPIFVNVKTTMSEKVGAAHIEVIGGNRAESVEGASSEVEPGLVVVAKGGENLTVHGACQISVGGACQETVDGNYSIESPASLSLIGSLHDVKAKGKITFTCGASSLVVDGAGVTIQSPVVKIDGSALKVTGSVSDG